MHLARVNATSQSRLPASIVSIPAVTALPEYRIVQGVHPPSLMRHGQNGVLWGIFIDTNSRVPGQRRYISPGTRHDVVNINTSSH